MTTHKISSETTLMLRAAKAISENDQDELDKLFNSRSAGAFLTEAVRSFSVNVVSPKPFTHSKKYSRLWAIPIVMAEEGRALLPTEQGIVKLASPELRMCIEEAFDPLMTIKMLPGLLDCDTVSLFSPCDTYHMCRTLSGVISGESLKLKLTLSKKSATTPVLAFLLGTATRHTENYLPRQLGNVQRNRLRQTLSGLVTMHLSDPALRVTALEPTELGDAVNAGVLTWLLALETEYRFCDVTLNFISQHCFEFTLYMRSYREDEPEKVTWMMTATQVTEEQIAALYTDLKQRCDGAGISALESTRLMN